MVLGDLEALGDEARQVGRAGVVDAAVVVDVLGQPQQDLVGGRRDRRRTVMGVDDEEVDGVGTDIDDTKAHGATVDARGCCPARAHA